MTPEIAQAVNEIRQAIPGSALVSREDGEGGAFVTIEEVALGYPYNQSTTWVGFHITYQYPYADVYPYFVRGDLSRVDGRQLGEGLTGSTFENRSAVQVSRRSNNRNPAFDSAYLKLLRILEWLKQR